MAGLTFANQVGAIYGMNQAAPGTLIPDTFVRWSQDVLFDRAGLMRRRGPFNDYTLYKEINGSIVEWDPTDANAVDERILGVFSTYDPDGAERIGILVSLFDTSNNYSTILRVFDNSFKFLGSEVLPFNLPPLSIVVARPALGGGMWISAVNTPANVGTHYLFYWRGGYSSKTSSITGTFTTETIDNFSSEHRGISRTITVSTSDNVYAGQFVYGTYNSNDYYLGVVKGVVGTTVTLEKRPYIWNPSIDNNHYIKYTGVTASSNANTITINLGTNNTVPFEAGDVLDLSGFSVSGYNTLTAQERTVVTVSGTTFTLTSSKNPGNATGGVVKMANDLEDLESSGTISLSLKFVSVRPYTHRHGRGLLSILDADSPSIISGSAGTSGDGHWQAANVAGYNLYRASDNAYIGKVKPFDETTNNTTAYLYADPGVKLNGEEYIMRPTSATNLTNDFCLSSTSANSTPYSFAGLYTTVYAGLQWYGSFAQDDKNTNRVVFSAYHDKEAVDLSRDAADSIIFPGKSKFRGMGASNAGLLIFLEDKTYILRGNDRTNFSVEQLIPEGCLCPSSIVEYGGGVFWAGKSGIMHFDGASVRNLTRDNLGLYYTDSLDVFNAETDRVMGFIHKNNLVMHYTSWKSPFDPIRYEPVYAEGWDTTPIINGKPWTEFDPAFSEKDFETNKNVPIYWDRQILNKAAEGSQSGLSLTWGGNLYFKTATTTSGSTTISGLTGMNSSHVGMTVAGNGIPTGATISSVTNATTIVISSNATVTSTAGAAIAIYTPRTNLKWGNTSNIYKWGPLRKNTTMTFSIYLPTNALTTLSNLDFRGVSTLETKEGIKTIVGVNSVEDDNLRARIIDIHPVFDTLTDGPDPLFVEKLNIPYADLVVGPDFYLQTKHYTVGDPVLRKWFQRVMLSMLLYDGCIRMDFVDDDDNDSVDINKKKHKYWELFTESGYDWTYLTNIQFPKITSPDRSDWDAVENSTYTWNELFTADFNRYMKRFSWRKSSIGFRLYQLNKYKRPYNGVINVPTQIQLQAISIGFKPMRQGRI